MEGRLECLPWRVGGWPSGKKGMSVTDVGRTMDPSHWIGILSVLIRVVWGYGIEPVVLM